jgi:hypothetical protein
MPINWNTEAEAKVRAPTCTFTTDQTSRLTKNNKLFLGVLAQLKNHNLKLDYKMLAEYMGPGIPPRSPGLRKERQPANRTAECSVPAVKQRVQKLRRDAESPPSGDGNGAAAAPAASPAGGGQKRKNAGGGGRKAGAGKKAKVDAAGAGGEKDDEV